MVQVFQNNPTLVKALSRSEMMTSSSAADKTPGRNDSEVYDDGCLRVEHKTYFAVCKGTVLSLPRAEFLLLSRMARNINRVVRTEDLWDHVWSARKPLNSDSLHVTVCRLRRKMELFGFRIDSMVNVGYSLSHESCCEVHSSTTQRDESELLNESLHQSPY